MSIKDKKAKELLNLIEALTDDILTTSDEEILKETEEEGIDIEAYSTEMILKLQTSLLEKKKGNLLKAQESIEGEKKKEIGKEPLQFKKGEAKTLVKQLLSDTDNNYTLAARSGNDEEMSERDAHSLLEDIRDLDELDEEDNL